MGKLKALWETNDGPIPGENFTSNTKNYAWHRPPDIKDFDEAIDAFIKKVVSDKTKSTGLVTLIDMGLPILTATDIILTQGVSAGKWTVDLALMIAGPIARIIEMMVKGAGITDYVTGWDDDRPLPTKTFFDIQNSKSPSQTSLARAKREALKAATEVKDNDLSNTAGLGAMPTANKDGGMGNASSGDSNITSGEVGQ